MIVSDTLSYGQVIAALQSAEQQLRRQIQVTQYTLKEFVDRKQQKHHFIVEVLRQPKLMVIGTENDVAFLKQPGCEAGAFAVLDAPALMPLPAQSYEIARLRTVRRTSTTTSRSASTAIACRMRRFGSSSIPASPHTPSNCCTHATCDTAEGLSLKIGHLFPKSAVRFDTSQNSSIIDVRSTESKQNPAYGAEHHSVLSAQASPPQQNPRSASQVA